MHITRDSTSFSVLAW